MRCTNFKKHISGHLLGFATIETKLENFSIELKGCKLFRKENMCWLTLPEHEFTNNDGQKAFACDFRFSELADKKEFCIKAKEEVIKWINKEKESKSWP